MMLQMQSEKSFLMHGGETLCRAEAEGRWSGIEERASGRSTISHVSKLK